MMECSFCGSTALFSDTTGITECMVDIIQCLCHGIFLLAGGPNILMKWFKLQSPCDMTGSRSWVRFPGHTFRWIISLIVVYFLVLEMAEGLLASLLSGVFRIHCFLPNLIGLLALVFSLGLYDFAETNNLVRFLFISFLYWTAVVVVRFLKLVALYQQGLGSQHARLILCWIIVSLAILLLLIDIVVLKTQGYLGKFPRLLYPAEELSRVNYLNPYTNLFNRLTLHWLTPLLVQGYRKALEMRDLGAVPQMEHSKYNFQKMKSIFEDEVAACKSHGKGSPSLWRCYWRAYWPMMLLAGLFKFLADMLIFVPPMLLDHIVNYVASVVENKDNNVTAEASLVGHPLTLEQYFSNGYILSLIILAAGLLQATFWQHHFYLSSRQGIRLKGAIQAMVYDKTLRLSSGLMSEGGISQGQVVNHMSVDPMHLFMFFHFGHLTWTLPLQVVVTLCLLYRQLGVCSLISAAAVMCMVPCQYLLARGLARCQKKTLEFADKRLKQCNELLQSIKLLKLYAWELVFCQNIENTRSQELRCLLKAAGFRVLSIAVTDGTPFVATMIAFVTYPFLEEKPLEAGKVFSSLALFNILGVPLFLVTMLISILAHAKTSTARLVPFLLSPELETQEKQAEDTAKEVPDVQYYTQTSSGSMNSHLLNNAVHADIEPIKEASGHEAVNFEQSCESNAAHPLLPKSGGLPQIEVTDENLETCQYNSDAQPINGVVSDVTICVSDYDSDLAHKGKESVKWDSSVVDNLCKSYNPDADTCSTDDNIVVQNGSFSWDLASKETVLHDINIKIPTGKLTVVVGSVGSGKTSLLSAILGEMTTINGKVTWKQGLKVAYGAQKAWLVNATLKDNILFGHNFDAEKYEKVVSACALSPDIAMLPGGDLTEIGEKGINLSGGQKQRVSIARTLYSGADIVILDDPMSALDVHVGSHIFQEAILGLLLQECKTVILVTHQLKYLNQAHQVVVMKEGHIAIQGSLAHIRQQDPKLYLTWKTTVEHSKKGHQKHTEIGLESIDASLERDNLDRQLSDHQGLKYRSFDVGHSDALPLRAAISIHSLSCISLRDEEEEAIPPAKEINGSWAEKGKLIEEEDRQVGSVSWRVILSYVRAATILFSFLAVFGYSSRQAVRLGTDFWLAEWSEAARLAEEVRLLNFSAIQSLTNHNETGINEDEGYDLFFYVRRFCYLCIAGLILGVTCIIFLECASLTAARNLHQRMLQGIVRAPMRFFDTTPVGRIINRMSGDTNTLDEKMPVTWDGVLFTCLFVLGGILVNAVSTPIFILPAAPIMLIYLGLLKFYIASSRELQRLDNVTKSPILAHFSETLGGLATIRAYGDQKRFREQNWKNIDANNTAFLYLHTANVWMGIRLDYLGIAIVFAAAMCSITAGVFGQVSPGIVGLTVAYAILNTMFFSWLVQELNHVVMYMTCTERMLEYAKIPTEIFNPDKGVEPANDWPSQGVIRFENVSLRYDVSLEPVVHRLTLHIKGGQKIGICGRTGSGKSSLTLSLFHLIDVCEGHIYIDDLDISRVPLHTLRSRLSIIPQDPVLFEGTVRFNLDPEGQREDEDIWQALSIAQLRPVIHALPQQLDSTVSEGGENFSLGQRQLFCLARAFLRNSRILVMDEATASVDMETDVVVQEVVKTAFKDRTILIIAHRVATILNCDRVLVLQDGKVVEHDTPQNLLATDSVFAAMVHSNR